MEIKKSYAITEPLGNETFQFIVVEGTEGRKPVRTVMCDNVVYFSGTPKKFKCEIDQKWVYGARLQRRYRTIDSLVPVETPETKPLIGWLKDSRYHIAKLLNILREAGIDDMQETTMIIGMIDAAGNALKKGYRLEQFSTEVARWLKFGCRYDVESVNAHYAKEHPQVPAKTEAVQPFTETWKPVKGYEGLYEVSSIGRVKSVGRKTASGNHPERMLKARKSKDYWTVMLRKDKHTSSQRICRLVAEAFIPNPDKLPFVMHINGHKGTDNSWNLKWTAQAVL